MNDLFYSIPTITFCITGYYLSWQYFSKNDWKNAIILLMICGLALRIYTSCDFFLHSWDERYHALVAKNLIHHPFIPTLYDNPILPYDYRDWTSNHIWLHKQPLPIWLMSASIRLFGVNEIALRLPSILMTTFGIYLCYFIGSYFSDRKTGYLAALFYSINGLIVEMTSGRGTTDHIDIAFLFFIQLSIFSSIMYVKTSNTIFNILTGISIGAAILSKWLPALIVIPIWLLIVCDAKNYRTKSTIIQLSILIFFCLLTFLPWQIYIFKTFTKEAIWEAELNLKHITQVLDGRYGPFYYYLDKIRINYGELIYFPLFWFLWKTYKDITNKKSLAICVWILLPIIFFSIAKTKMQAYILFISPALFIVTSQFFFYLKDYKKEIKSKWIINLILLLLIVLPIRYTFERVKPFASFERKPHWVIELKRINNENISRGILFNYNRPIEAMFYTNLVVYPNIPDKNKIIELITNGYIIIINDDDNIPDEIKCISNIRIEKLNTY